MRKMKPKYLMIFWSFRTEVIKQEKRCENGMTYFHIQYFMSLIRKLQKYLKEDFSLFSFSNMKLSIYIPTFNRPSQLYNCLILYIAKKLKFDFNVYNSNSGSWL